MKGPFWSVVQQAAQSQPKPETLDHGGSALSDCSYIRPFSAVPLNLSQESSALPQGQWTQTWDVWAVKTDQAGKGVATGFCRRAQECCSYSVGSDLSVSGPGSHLHAHTPSQP